jgi:hypothetical protein
VLFRSQRLRHTEFLNRFLSLFMLRGFLSVLCLIRAHTGRYEINDGRRGDAEDVTENPQESVWRKVEDWVHVERGTPSGSVKLENLRIVRAC